MNIKLLTDHHLELLSLKIGCTGSSESTHVKVPHYWKSHVAAHIKSLIVLCLVVSIEAAYYEFCCILLYGINKGSNMSAHDLLNLLNELGISDKMRGLPSILSFFATSLINSIMQVHECKILLSYDPKLL